MRLPEKMKAYAILKDEMVWIEGFLSNNEAIYATDVQRYNMFKQEWGKRKKECQEKMDGLG